MSQQEINNLNTASNVAAGIGISATVVAGGIEVFSAGTGAPVAAAAEMVAAISDDVSAILGLAAGCLELEQAEKSGNKTEEIEAGIQIGVNALQILMPFVPNIAKYSEKDALKMEGYSPEEIAKTAKWDKEAALKMEEQSQRDLTESDQFYRSLLVENRKYGITLARKEWKMYNEDYRIVSKGARKQAGRANKKLFEGFSGDDFTLANIKRELLSKRGMRWFYSIYKKSPEVRAIVKKEVEQGMENSPTIMKKAMKELFKRVNKEETLTDGERVLRRFRNTQYRIGARIVRFGIDTAHVIKGVTENVIRLKQHKK